MRPSGQGSGGGLGSRPVTHARAPKAEPRPNKMSVKATSQIGQSLGNHITQGRYTLSGVAKDLYAGRGYSPPVGPTDNVKAVGVGGGRSVHGCGTQGQHGPVAGARRPPGRSFDD
jgi:hypothetical protein